MTEDNEELVFPPDEEGQEDQIKESEAEVTDTDLDDIENLFDAEDNAADDEDDEDDDDGATADQTAELEKRYMALFAEYENFRKRSAKEKEDLYASAVASVTKDWLAVLDNIDRALQQSKTAGDDGIEKVIQGIEMIGKQAGDVLAKLGVTEIEAERGTAFDPKFHEAVMHIEDGDLGENQIAQVFQKGYIYKDRVVRHAVVQVAN